MLQLRPVLDCSTEPDRREESVNRLVDLCTREGALEMLLQLPRLRLLFLLTLL